VTRQKGHTQEWEFKRRRCLDLVQKEPDLEPDQLAERLGIDETTIRKWLASKKRDTTRSTHGRMHLYGAALKTKDRTSLRRMSQWEG
jgi:DeoR/GlpR family transcriptional regulator of sugar metabolism